MIMVTANSQVVCVKFFSPLLKWPASPCPPPQAVSSPQLLLEGCKSPFLQLSLPQPGCTAPL